MESAFLLSISNDPLSRPALLAQIWKQIALTIPTSKKTPCFIHPHKSHGVSLYWLTWILYQAIPFHLITVTLSARIHVLDYKVYANACMYIRADAGPEYHM